jgi:hypothetical protein
MNALVISFVRVLRNAGVVLLVFFNQGSAVRAHSATIDFDYPNPIPPNPHPPDWRLPWREDGYTVVAGDPFQGSRILATIPVTGGSPPYPGLLQIVGSSSSVGLVIITNDASLPFDLVSVDVVNVSLGFNSPTNYASIKSSAGGSYSLLGTPNGTTVYFGDSHWRDLSFLRIEFLTDTRPSLGLELDNFVFQPGVVPEPSNLWFCVLAVAGILWGKRRAWH